MTFWRILPHATACMAADAIVLLDIRQDRYFLVPAVIATVTERWLLAADDSTPPAGFIAMLGRSEIRRPGDAAPTRERCDVLLPVTLEERLERKSIRLGQRARIDGIVAATWLGLRLTPLRAHLDRLARNSSDGPRLDQDRLRERIRVFRQARRFNPIARNCLLDSLALAWWLSAGGHPCRIVFGVMATPFAAHCWIQDDQSILNDHYDRVSRFAPIFAS
jgi:hypothetical protein